jgi:transposase
MERVAKRLGISRPTVTKWRSRFVARRLEALADEPRPGAVPAHRARRYAGQLVPGHAQAWGT